MKKEVKIVIAVVLAVWLFVMGFEIGGYAEKKKFVEAQSTLPAITTTVPTTFPTTMPTVPTSQDSNNTDTSDGGTTGSNTSADPSSMSKDEIVRKVNTYMNQIKSEQNVQFHETATVYVNVVDCSVPSVIGTINNVISGIVGKLDPEQNYTFVGGQAVNKDGNTITLNDVVPPLSKTFSLPVEGVASAKAEKQGDNTVYTINTVAENTTIENQVPPYHDNSLGYLDITAFDLPINVTKGDMHYPGSTLIVTVDGNDKVIGVNVHLPMTGEGGTKILGQEGTASFEGALDKVQTFTYQ